MVQRWGEGVHMNRGRVGEERGGKEMDGCPLTVCWKCMPGTFRIVTMVRIGLRSWLK
jgi:hypothetical protein